MTNAPFKSAANAIRFQPFRSDLTGHLIVPHIEFHAGHINGALRPDSYKRRAVAHRLVRLRRDGDFKSRPAVVTYWLGVAEGLQRARRLARAASL